jgi:hypothetical protein
MSAQKAIHGGGWSTPRPSLLYPQERDPVPTAQGAGWVPRAGPIRCARSWVSNMQYIQQTNYAVFHNQLILCASYKKLRVFPGTNINPCRILTINFLYWKIWLFTQPVITGLGSKPQSSSNRHAHKIDSHTRHIKLGMRTPCFYILDTLTQNVTAQCWTTPLLYESQRPPCWCSSGSTKANTETKTK